MGSSLSACLVLTALTASFFLFKHLESQKSEQFFLSRSQSSQLDLYPGNHSDPSNQKPSSTSSRGHRRFVKLEPGDDGSDLDAVFRQDMTKFIPAKNHLGESVLWGLRKYKRNGYPVIDIDQAFRRRMVHQTHYYNHGAETPECQFVRYLMAKKKAQLEKLNVNNLQKRDYIIKLTFPWIPLNPLSSDAHDRYFENGDIEPHLISRKFKVSGGINLDTLQDKILQPIVGWERNSHAWIFTDLKDGACFGPKDCSAPDIMHLTMVYYDFLYAEEYTLAHLAQKEGERIQYTYDLGANWCHNLKIEKILSEQESDGAVVLLEGHGMCPPENGGGNGRWAEDVYNLRHGTRQEKTEVRHKLSRAPNVDLPPGTIDPKYFSIDEANKRLRDALRSHSSLRDGARTSYVFPGVPSPELLRLINPPRRGATVNRTIEAASGSSAVGLTEEVVSHRRDKNAKALCAVCGKAQGLKACTKCRKVWYCGSQHQLDDWQEHRRHCQCPKPRVH
ncbi:hypothetical protein SISSUDRAFT_1128146 [Sistotremastrum suecicum HHB10207 ss-3]|uniref:MYND-type domain-containing protein n=1 Tax=Sistotremastrum suecicum HHB10207 ss-3 TaxID=1314776 RepID=A0A166E8Q4_9AGAM|nr:hypothetical protein SISSUDRAFT_1128146 [Sistotremastrum suecicum HHB10207 ss-3]